MNQGYLRRNLLELVRVAGIHKRVHALGLRPTHASELGVEGVDIAVIKRQLWHRSLLTTIEYLDHIQPSFVLASMSCRKSEICHEARIHS